MRVLDEEVGAAWTEVVLEEKARRETGDVLLQGDVGIDAEKASEGEDEDFRDGVVDGENGMGDQTVFVVGVGREDAVLVVVPAGTIANLGVQGDCVGEMRA